MSDLFLLSEAQLCRIKPYFPLSHGVPRVDDRRVLSGIIFVIRNGLRWRDAPGAYGPPKTLYNRFSLVRAHQRALRTPLHPDHGQPAIRRMVAGLSRPSNDSRGGRPPRSPLDHLRNERRQLQAPRRAGTKTARPGTTAKPRDNHAQRRCVAPRQSTTNLTLATDNQQEHQSNNAVTDSDPD